MGLTTSRSRQFLQTIWVLIPLTISGLSSSAQMAPRDLKSVDAEQILSPNFLPCSLLGADAKRAIFEPTSGVLPAIITVGCCVTPIGYTPIAQPGSSVAKR